MRSITITPSLPFALLLLSLLIQCTAITGVDAIFGWGKSRRSKAAVETTAAPDNGADPLNPEPISPPSPPSSSRALMTDVVVSRIIPPGSNLEETQTKSGEPGDGPIFFSGEALRVQWRWANGVPQKHVRAYLIRQGGLFKSKVKTYHFATPDDELLAAESASMDIPLPNFASSGRYYFRFIEYEITEKSSIFRSGPSKRTERYLDAHEARFRIENTMSRFVKDEVQEAIMNIQMAINKLQEQLVILIRPVVEVSVNAAKCTGHYAYEGGKCVLKSAAAAGVTVVGAAVLAGKGVGHISVEGAKRFGHGVRFAVDKTAAGLVEAKDYTVDAAVKTGRAVGRSAKHVYQSVENLIDRFARSLIRHAAQNSRIRQENQRYTVPHGSE